MRPRLVVPAVLVCSLMAVTLLGTPAGAATPKGHVGSGSSGDPYFPRQGNGGYNVASYSLQIHYTPSTKKLIGIASIRARARTSLSRFDLDLRRNLHVRAVTVDGHRAKYAQPASRVQELVITPRRVLHKGHHFTVVVHYRGKAKHVTDPDGSADGFIATSDGAFVASEPQGSPTWFPVNDTPRDKATYRVSITVPKGLTGVSNGVLTSVHRSTHTTTWNWQLNRRVSSYLVTATLGRFDLTRGKTRKGVPYVIAIDPTLKAHSNAVLTQTPKVVDYFSSVYGRYPFGSTGGIVDNGNVGYALETATRPLYDYPPDVATVSHELAHQWFGDDVTVSKWRDIWLNEGFAEFSSWLYDEHRGAETTAQHFRQVMAHPDGDYWNPPPGNPGSGGEIFSGSVYERGAATLEALRMKLGWKTFMGVMRGWVHAHRYGNATVAQFTRYAEKKSHRDLDHFFHVWLYAKGKPKV